MKTDTSKDARATFLYFPHNKGWSHQINRAIVESHNGGGDFGEIDRAASQMTVGDPESWHKEWMKMAEYVEALGSEAEKKTNLVTARQAFFRASNYYRLADFFLGRDDPREHATYRRQVNLFEKAGMLCKPKIESVKVPFEGKSLHAYFIPSISGKRSPTIIVFGGADATCEEVYFNTGAEASQRGFSILMIDGPGQGYTLRFEKLYARYNYETAVAAAIEFLLKRKNKFVDPNKVAIIGRSMGGYYASRAAAKEKRIRAAVIFDAIFDITEDVYDFFPPVRRAVNWDVGATDDEEARRKLSKFNLSGVAEEIDCPLLIIHGSDDYVSSPKAAEKLLAAAGTKDKQLKWYKAGHGVAAYRAEATAFVMDWLKTKLRSK